jgi:hypothetical protein
MILVDPDNLAAHPTRDLAQLAFLIGRGLIDRADAEIDNCSAHSSIFSVWQMEAKAERSRVRAAILALRYLRDSI